MVLYSPYYSFNKDKDIVKRESSSPDLLEKIKSGYDFIHVYEDGTKVYYTNSSIHREDGPAVIFPDGIIEWWYDDDEYSFEIWCIHTEKTNEEIVQLKLQYG